MHRCDQCGYLAMRSTETRQLIEAEKGVRESWVLPDLVLHPGTKSVEQLPICFAGEDEYLFPPGQKAESDYHAVTQTILSNIQREHTCPAFIPWMHGRSPREHDEMRLADEQRKRDLAWQDEQRTAIAAREELRDKKNGSRQFWNVIIGGLLALLGGAAVNYFFPKPQPQIVAVPPVAPLNGEGR